MVWTKITDAANGAAGGAIAEHGGLLYVYDGSGILAAYDLTAGTWSAPLTPPPTSHANGAQLIAVAGNKLVLMSTTGPQVQIYDIATDAWTVGADYPHAARYCQFATNGSVIYGAMADQAAPTYGNTTITVTAIYDPATDTWDTTTLPAPPDYATDSLGGLGYGSLHWIPATANSPHSLVYVNGWWNQNWPVGETFVLDLDTPGAAWLPGSNQDLPREDQAPGSSGIAGVMEYAIVVGGDGGDTIGGSVHQMVTCEAYDSLNDAWTGLDDLPVALDNPDLTVGATGLYVYGGYGRTSDLVGPAPFDGAQTAIYRLPFTSLPTGGLLPQPSPDVPPATQLQLEAAVIDTPGFITVSVSNVPAGGLVSFRLDVDDSAHEIDTATVDDSGNLIHHDVLVSDHLVNGSTHTLYAHNVDTGSDGDTFLVDNNQPGEEFMADPVPPLLIPRTGVQRWYFQDPTGQTPDHFIFPRNPHTYSTPYADKVIGYDFTTGGPERGQMITMEGKPKPVSWTFEGVLLTKAEEAQFTYWFKRSYRIYIIDHENRAYLAYITHFDVTPKHSVNHPEKRDYKMTATVYGFPVQL